MHTCCSNALYSSRHEINVPFIHTKTYIHYSPTHDCWLQTIELKYFGHERSISQAISYCPFCGKKLPTYGKVIY